MIRWWPLVLLSCTTAPEAPTAERVSWPGAASVEQSFQRTSRVIHGDAPPLVQIDDAGHLSYGRYANRDRTSASNILPDFSHAGYRGGGVAIPDVPVVLTIDPLPGDNRASVQAAIDTVAALPLEDRGAILLTAGTYEVEGSLDLNASGIVLRGAGSQTGGTELVATLASQHSLIRVHGTGSGFSEHAGTRTAITADVAVGADRLRVADASAFQAGDTIIVERTPNQAWIDELGMAPWGWTPSSYAIGHERVVRRVRGNTLLLDIPMVDTIEAASGGGAVYRASIDGRIAEVGIEDLRLRSTFASSTDENHGWTAIDLRRTRDSWVRRVTALHFGYAAVQISAESRDNTIEEVAHLDPISQISGGRRYPFVVQDGIGNLFQRCYARNGRHNFVSGSRVTGPNVWLDCLGVSNHNDDGPHHRWSTGLLFDNTSSAELHVQNRQSSGSGHGWAGAQVLFYNASATSLICDAPQGAMNWAIGHTGTLNEGNWSVQEPPGTLESLGTPVRPRSLYLAQLADRLGARAVMATTTAAQRRGRIWQQLAAWAGEGALQDAVLTEDPWCSTGLPSGDACCAASCGTCGGSGCGGAPGGSDACCTGSILANAPSCLDSPPPCVISEPDPTCATGIASGDACCDAGCGSCGGSGCNGRPGGADACCTTNIRTGAPSCSDAEPPCVIDPPDPTCATGIQSGDACCAASCGTCGGAGCSGLIGGSAACCGGAITASGRSCADHPPPCVVP